MKIILKENFIDNIIHRKIPVKYRDVYKKINGIFSGSYDIKFIPDYREWPKDKPEAVIKVGGSDDSFVGGKPFFMKRLGDTKKKFSSSGVLTFYLDRNMKDIVNWLNGTSGEQRITKEDPYGEEDWSENPTQKKDDMEDYLDNFDEYNGEGYILPTKDTPYEFVDTD